MPRQEAAAVVMRACLGVPCALLLLAPGCASPQPLPSAAPLTASIPPAASSASLAPSAPVPSPSASTAPAPSPTPAPSPFVHAAPTPATPGPGEVRLFDATTEIPDLDAWLKARRSTQAAVARAGASTNAGCRALTLAVSPSDLLVCTDGGMDQTGEFDRVAVLTVDAGNNRVVFQQTTHMTDAPDEGPFYRGHEIQLSVLVRDGRDLVVREDDSTCGVLASSLEAGYRARAVKMCGGVGRYLWSFGRFSRAGAP